MKRILMFLAVCILLLHSANALAQEQKPADTTALKAGIIGGILYNFHSSDFRALPGVPSCCPQYESGSAMGIGFGAFAELSLGKHFSILLNAGYDQQNADFEKNEPLIIGINGEEAAGESRHTLNAKLGTLALEPMFGWRISEDFGIYLGPRFGLPLSKTYEQKEELVKPTNEGVFLDTRTRLRNNNSGDVQNVSGFLLGASIMLRKEFPLNYDNSVQLAIFGKASFGLTNVVQDLKWNAHFVSAGLALVFNIAEFISVPEQPKPKIEPVIEKPSVKSEPKIAEKPLEQPVIAAKENKIEVSVRAVTIDDGKELKNVPVNVEEFLSTSMKPLLSYIFFEENDAEIPQRYNLLTKEMAAKFNLNDLYNTSTMQTYYNVLNIIGKRLSDNPKTKIRLVGCNANINDEKGNLELSRARAEAVAAYFKNIWQISDNRISISTKNLPSNPSTPDSPDGAEENRRVEIYCDNYDITAPVITNDTLRQVTPNVIRFYPIVKSESAIDFWRVVARQGERILKEFTNSGIPPTAVDWNINDEKSSIPSTAQAIEYFIEAVGQDGSTALSPVQTMKIEQKTIKQKSQKQTSDKRIDYYSIILFEFNSPQLSQEQLRQSKFIKDRIESNSKVTITGYTDRMGEDEYNIKLSEGRARNMARALKLDNVEIKGLGKSLQLYDNTLPEGRFYCRTVEVIVETPLVK